MDAAAAVSVFMIQEKELFVMVPEVLFFKFFAFVPGESSNAHLVRNMTEVVCRTVLTEPFSSDEISMPHLCHYLKSCTNAAKVQKRVPSI